MGRHTPTGAPDGMELAIGIGNHQVISRILDAHTLQATGWRIDAGWRAHLAFRTLLLPSEPEGPVIEGELQNGAAISGQTATSFSLTLGYRFHV
jgi:hypothetical protein